MAGRPAAVSLLYTSMKDAEVLELSLFQIPLPPPLLSICPFDETEPSLKT